eukprot:gene18230-21721_t
MAKLWQNLRIGCVDVTYTPFKAIHRLGDTSGLSQNQIEFMKRKHGLLPPEPAPEIMPPPEPVSEFSAEQLEFLQRRSTEGRGAYGFSTEGAGPVSPAAAPRPVESTSTSPAHSPVREVEEPVPVDVSGRRDPRMSLDGSLDALAKAE